MAPPVFPCIDKERDNGLFAKSFGCFQPVQTFDKYEARRPPCGLTPAFVVTAEVTAF